MNHKDTIIQQLTPVVPVPRFEALPPDRRGNGHRFLAAQDGLWVETETPWLLARQLVAPAALALPFGELEPQIRFKCGPLPKTLLEKFVGDARKASPRETAAIMTWCPDTRDFTLIPVALDAGAAHVHYERPRLEAGEYLVADLHSHGRYPAGFSAQDDQDDFGEIKVSIVVGECDTTNPGVAVRLCLLGMYTPLHHTGGTQLGKIAEEVAP